MTAFKKSHLRRILSISETLAVMIFLLSCSRNLPETLNWYKGNTHTHATFSDENDTNDVPEIASWYEKAGYNFLVLSEHNDHLREKKIFSHDELSRPPSFLMISGLELSNSRHHLAFGINSYIGDETSLQDGVEKTLSAGGIPILNHPQSKVVKCADFLAVKGLNHIEIANGGRPGDTPASEVLWDSILSAPNGRQVFAVGADDNHYSEKNVGRAWIMVKAPALTKEQIMENFRKGNYYVTTGVILNDYQVEEKTINVSSANGDTIIFIGKYGSILKTIPGKEAEYKINGDELYVRAKINGGGKSAWTQPVFISPSPSGHFSFVYLPDIHLRPNPAVKEGFEHMVACVNSLHPDFVLTGGDMIYTAKTVSGEKAAVLFDFMDKEFNLFRMPVKMTMGNHENVGIAAESGIRSTDPDWGKRMFERRYNKRYYSFIYNGWKFFVLDGIKIREKEKDYTQGIDKEQIEWIEKELVKTDTSMPVAISMHTPFVNPHDILSTKSGPVSSVSDSVLELFKRHNLKLVMEGHTHLNMDLTFEGISYLSGGSTEISTDPLHHGFYFIRVNNESEDHEFIKLNTSNDRVKQ